MKKHFWSKYDWSLMKYCQPGEGLSAAALPRDKDPFWDPVEPLLLGTAHLWLQSLAFRIPVDEQLEVLHSHPHTHISSYMDHHGIDDSNHNVYV